MNGFKSDGSYYYGGLILYGREWDENFSDTIKRIEKGIIRFEYSDEVNPIAINTTREIVEICRENGIELIAFIPPYAPSIYDMMDFTAVLNYTKKLPMK